MTTSSASLGELEAFLCSALLRVDPLSNDAKLVPQVEEVVAPGLRLTPVQQLEIYQEQFWLRHVGAMKEDFATVHHLLGDDGFRRVCEAYFAAYPPRSFTLRDLGGSFSDFLSHTEPWASDTFLRDCARLEWAFVEAFDAFDAPPLDPETIAAAPEEAWGGASLVFHPSVQFVPLSYPAHNFRRDVKEERSPERPPPEPVDVVVFRGPERLMYVPVEPLAFRLLALLANGDPLAASCERVANESSDEGPTNLEEKVGPWFQAWASYGWVSQVVFPKLT